MDNAQRQKLAGEGGVAGTSVYHDVGRQGLQPPGRFAGRALARRSRPPFRFALPPTLPDDKGVASSVAAESDAVRPLDAGCCVC